MPKGNPDPVQPPEFLAKKFPPAPDLPEGTKLGKPICVALPEDLDKLIRAMPNRSQWLRKAITEVAKADGLYSDSGEE